MLAKNTLIVNMQPEKDSNIAVYIPSHKSCNKFIQTYLTRAYRGVCGYSGHIIDNCCVSLFILFFCFLCLLCCLFSSDIHPHISNKIFTHTYLTSRGPLFCERRSVGPEKERFLW